MKALSYKGYSARIEFDGDDEIFFGRIAGIQDVVGFHADTVTDLKAAFHEAVEHLKYRRRYHERCMHFLLADPACMHILQA